MKPRFLVDGMLGSLARWLRIAGYNAVYRRGSPDNELLEDAKKQGRILLTKDKELVERANRLKTLSVYVKGSTEKEQLITLGTTLNLLFDASTSRCSKCNDSLRIADAMEVNEKVPIASRKAFDEFWICDSCSSVYWRGSHWESILAMFSSVNTETRKKSSKSLY